MLNSIFYQAFRLLLLTFVQVMVLNNVHLHGLFNPYIYPLFLLLLPIETSPALLLLLGFLNGWLIDIYSHTGAIHASATVLIAFIRPFLLSLMRPAPGYQPEDKPTVASMGFLWFFTYCALLIFIHHLWVFIAESFSLTQFIFVIEKIAVSSIISISIIIMLQYLFYRRKTSAVR